MFFSFTFLTAHYIFHFFLCLICWKVWNLTSLYLNQVVLLSFFWGVFFGWENVWGYQCIFFLFIFMASLLNWNKFDNLMHLHTEEATEVCDFFLNDTTGIMFYFTVACLKFSWTIFCPQIHQVRCIWETFGKWDWVSSRMIGWTFCLSHSGGPVRILTAR